MDMPLVFVGDYGFAMQFDVNVNLHDPTLLSVTLEIVPPNRQKLEATFAPAELALMEQFKLKYVVEQPFVETGIYEVRARFFYSNTRRSTNIGSFEVSR